MKGVGRSCVILNNPTTRLQFIRVDKETDIYAFERYIDSSASDDWLAKAIDWLTKSVDLDN